MNKVDRVRAALACEAVDRPPYSFWTHLPGIDLHPQKLAAATAEFTHRFDLDFVKSMPNGLYCVEDWGCVCDYSDIERGGVAKVVDAAVKEVADWSALRRVDPGLGSFGRELEHYSALTGSVDVPVLATVFSPLTIAGKLSNGLSREHAARDVEAVRRGLDVITEVTCAFAREAIGRGCAGIFLAMQEAVTSAYDENEYRLLGEPYDRAVINASKAAGGWFNVVHLHGEDIHFDLVKDYNVTALNWHIGETAPSIGDYRRNGGSKPIVGGLQRGYITRRERDGIAQDIERSVMESGPGILLAPACVIRHPVDSDTLQWTAERIKALANS
jgi:uroporphyrinogen decarboxylase